MVMNPPATVSQPGVRKTGPVSLPLFGCRLMSVMQGTTPAGKLERSPRQDEFLRECFVKGDNSLKDQSRPYDQPKDGEEQPVSWEQFQSKVQSKDGWGFSAFSKEGGLPWLKKAPSTAYLSKDYDAAAEQAIERNPSVMMAHIRAGEEPCEEHSHPFTHNGWSWMHNGYVTNLKDAEPDAPASVGKPKGKTDTEAVFHNYFLAKLQDRYKTTDASKITPKQARETFAETVQEVIRGSFGNENQYTFTSADPNLFERAGIRLNKDSRVRTNPAGNFVVSNGNLTLASAYGCKLHLGLHENDRGTHDVLVASEPVQPKGTDQKKIQWIEVPNGHILMMQRDPKSGEIEVRIDPFTQAH